MEDYMNNNRRKKILEVIKMIDTTKNYLEIILEEEEECFDNIPENLQYSARGEDSQDAIDNMNEALEKLSDSIEYLNII